MCGRCSRRQNEGGRCVTPAGHLSRVSLHPTFTGTMSLRSLVRRLFQPPSFSTCSLAIEGLSWKILLVMGFYSGDTGSPPRHLHRSRLIFLPDRSFAVRASDGALGSIIAVVSTQQKSMRVCKNRTTHKTAPYRA